MQEVGTWGRRDFFLASGLGAAVAMAAIEAECRSSDAAEGLATMRSDGYRASPHVLKYYQTTEG